MNRTRQRSSAVPVLKESVHLEVNSRPGQLPLTKDTQRCGRFNDAKKMDACGTGIAFVELTSLRGVRASLAPVWVLS